MDSEHTPDDTANDGTVNAEPAGGWDDGDVAAPGGGPVTNAEKEQADEVDRGGSGEPAFLSPDGTPDGASDSFVESAEIQQGLDPDIVTDEQADQV